jgi:ankyrin repeat protein
MDTPFDGLAALLHELRPPEALRKPPPETLTAAVAAGDTELVRAFVAAGADIEERSVGFMSPLQAAASAGSLDMVELLLSLGADPREKPETLVYSPLSAAISNGHAAVVSRLLAAIPDLTGETRAFAQAASSGDAGTLARLLAGGAGPGAHAGHVLRLAASRGRFACVKLLLAAGVDPRAHPDYALDALGEPADAPCLPRDAARENGHTLVAALLDGKRVSEALAARAESRLPPPGEGLRGAVAALRAITGAPSGPPPEPPALEGDARHAAVARAGELIRAGAADGRSNQQAPGGHPFLVLAAASGHAEIVQALLDVGASPRAASPDGNTPVHEAARYGHREVAALLLAAGADPNARTNEQETPLITACRRGDLAVVRQLLAAGADPKARMAGKGPRYFACGPHKKAIRQAVEDAVSEGGVRENP